MSRKDYRRLATAIKDSFEHDASGPEAEFAVTQTAMNIAWALGRDNDRFNYDIFYAACGLVVNEDGQLRYKRS